MMLGSSLNTLDLMTMTRNPMNYTRSFTQGSTWVHLTLPHIQMFFQYLLTKEDILTFSFQMLLHIVTSHENKNVRKEVIKHLSKLIKANRDLFQDLIVNEELASMHFLTAQHCITSLLSWANKGRHQRYHNYNIEEVYFAIEGEDNYLIHTKCQSAAGCQRTQAKNYCVILPTNHHTSLPTRHKQILDGMLFFWMKRAPWKAPP